MEVQPDFKELLALFNAHGVEYLIVGGYALAHHGAPRFTGDLDLWVHSRTENAQRILAALDEFGFGSLNLSPKDFIKKDHVVQLGVPPVRVDIITSIDGVTWSAGWKGRTPGTYGGMPVFYIGKLNDKWTPPRPSSTNSALLWPDTLKYFHKKMRAKDPTLFADEPDNKERL